MYSQTMLLNLPGYTFLVLTICSSQVVHPVTATSDDQDGALQDEWVAEILGGQAVASDVSEQHGFRLVRELYGFPDHYLLKRHERAARSRRSTRHDTVNLSQDKRVISAEQQRRVIREKRDRFEELLEHPEERFTPSGLFNDPQFENQWYIMPSSSQSDMRRSQVRSDLRVVDVWARNLTGKGVVVCILDDGIEKDNPDLKDNYDPHASLDLNGDDDDPSPRYDPKNENRHGTRCAGVTAMVSNNKKCGVGIAYNAGIGGIRMLDGNVTDRQEGEAFSFRPEYIDIYSISWGPTDDGMTYGQPGRLAKSALEAGATKGRGGKGSIYVWAGGNGGYSSDNCNADGFVASIYALSVNSVSQFGHKPKYAEKCPATLASIYSSGNRKELRVVTSDLRRRCTRFSTGTSAAAPMAAGLVALLLESNPNLTWRDVQHIVVETSRAEHMEREAGWYKNGAGYCVNLAFGFGLMDALAMVELADPETWKSVGEQKVCKVEAANPKTFPIKYTANMTVEIRFPTLGCKGQLNEVNFLEHVVLKMRSQIKRRGDLYLELESPMGTVTPLMTPRPHDNHTMEDMTWEYKSTHTWAERPAGTWILRVVDTGLGGNPNTVKSAELLLYGTTEQPEYQKNRTKNCQFSSRRSPDALLFPWAEEDKVVERQILF